MRKELCSCCGGSINPIPIFNHSFFSEYARCESCQHVQLLNFPEETVLETFYEGYSASRSLSERLIDHYQRRAKAQVSYILRYLPLKNEEDVCICDVGCGYGFLLKELQPYAKKMIGIEIDEKCKQYIADTLKDFAIYLPPALTDNNYPWNMIDDCTLVCMSHYLEHECDCSRLIHNLRIHKCKWLFIEVPSEFSFRYERIDEAHIHYFTTQSLTKLLEKNGYTVIDIGCYGYTPIARSDIGGRVVRKVQLLFDVTTFYGDVRKNPRGDYLRALAEIKV